MIRRTFLKALCASPLGFAIPKAKPRRRYMKVHCSDADVRRCKVVCAKYDPLANWARDRAEAHARHIDEVIINAALGD